MRQEADDMRQVGHCNARRPMLPPQRNAPPNAMRQASLAVHARVTTAEVPSRMTRRTRIAPPRVTPPMCTNRQRMRPAEADKAEGGDRAATTKKRRYAHMRADRAVTTKRCVVYT